MFLIGVHIAETVHSSSRGSLAVFQSLFICIGMLVVLSLGYCVSDWRTLAWICMVPGCIHFIMIFFMHDTPYWLVEKNKRIEARLVLFEDIERKMLKGAFFHYYWCLDLLQLDFVFFIWVLLHFTSLIT